MHSEPETTLTIEITRTTRIRLELKGSPRKTLPPKAPIDTSGVPASEWATVVDLNAWRAA